MTEFLDDTQNKQKARNGFLHDLWQKKADAERGAEDKEVKNLRIWRDIELGCSGDANLEKLFQQVRRDILHYQATIHALGGTEREQETKEEIMSKDRSRRLAHNRLVDDLNLLSRQCKEKNISNKWRADVGLSDEEIGRWAADLKL